MSELKSCQFCNEEDFDLIGLKIHYSAGHCEQYNALAIPPRFRDPAIPIEDALTLRLAAAEKVVKVVRELVAAYDAEVKG